MRRNLIIAAVLLGVFTVAGFFVVPPIAKDQLEKRLSAELGRKVTVEKIRLNPYALSVTLEKFDIRLKDDSGSFLGWDRLYINFDALASLAGEWVIGAVELDGFHGAVVMMPDGSLNFADVLARLNAAAAPAPAAPAKPGRPVRVDRLQVQNAKLEFSDRSRSRPFATVLGPVSFQLKDFHSSADRGAPYNFEAQTDAGERLAWTGTLTAVPLKSSGEFRLENISLPKYAAYYADQIGAEIESGKLSLRGRYQVDLGENTRVLQLADSGVQLRNLKVVERTTQSVALELPSLDVTGINADGLTLKAAVAAVKLTGTQLNVRREKDGSINLLALLAPSAPAGVPAPAAATSAAPAAAPAKLPEVTLGELALQDARIALTDLTTPSPAKLVLEGMQVSLKNISLADGVSMPLSLAFNWAPQGTVQIAGQVSIKPDIKAELTTNVASLALLPLSPYLEQFVNAHLTQGVVSTNGTVGFALVGGSPAITFNGGVSAEQFGLVDGVRNEPLAGFSSFALKGIKAATSPQLSVELEEVALAGPYARAFVNADKTVNLALIAKSAPAPTATPVAEAPAQPAANPAPAPAPKIVIGRIVISEGNATFVDRSLEPNVQMGVAQFGGTIVGLSSENLGQASVDLKAAVDGVGPITITGKLDPLGAHQFADLKIDFKNVDLQPLSPYSGKFAGYELARGKLGLDVKVLLDGKKINATNVITLNQFTFGAPVPSPEATKLPVRLGVALLKDTEGRIVIDVPVQGNLDDPSFRIGKVVLRVIVNLLTKAAVSPFSLLGSMFGGGGDELAFQEFAPGSAELRPQAVQKLETMVKALTNRPALSLAIEGGYDGPADSYALRRQQLASLVRGKIWEQRHAIDPNIPPPEQIEITPEAQAAMVKRLFDEKFPPGTEFGAPLPPAPVVAAAAATKKKGFLRRVVDAVTFKSGRDEAPKMETAAMPPAAAAAATDGAPAGPSLEEMTGRLAETMAVTDNELRALAAARAQRVRDYFINEGKIAADRLFMSQDKEQKENKGPRVYLSLQ